MDYQIEELFRDTLMNDATMQGYVEERVWTDHISDLQDPKFPCITMHFFGGRWIGEGVRTFSYDRMELEISSDKAVAPKKQIDTIYARATILLLDQTVSNANYRIMVFADGKPMILPYYDDKKNRTIYKKTISYNLVDIDLQ